MFTPPGSLPQCLTALVAGPVLAAGVGVVAVRAGNSTQVLMLGCVGAVRVASWVVFAAVRAAGGVVVPVLVVALLAFPRHQFPLSVVVLV